MNRVKMMVVFGTRPEAIKLAPIIQKARQQNDVFETTVIVTAQHREMLDDVLAAFEITPDRDLNIMIPNQSILHVTSKILADMEDVIRDFNPDILVVQGDTTTTMAGAMCAFYTGKKVAHVEAGLRTGDKLRPFPEEVNRRISSVIADYHFAPTELARRNLLKEGHPASSIHVTGNTVIDALIWMVGKMEGTRCPVIDLAAVLNRYAKIVLITGHRRESFGEPIRCIFSALGTLARQYPGIAFVYPVHLNPHVQIPASELLGGLPNLFLVPPLPYPDFCWFMNECDVIITDSGGVQEEAPALGKPVLVTREVTERPEAVQKGMVKLVGHDESMIVGLTQRLLEDEDFYRTMAKGYSPYGDGKAAQRILNVLSNFFQR